MFKRRLLLVMILLTGLQAIASSADVHHVDEAPCVHSECGHHLQSSELVDNSDDDKHSSLDCHHCGHCARAFNQIMLVDYDTLDLKKHRTPLPAYVEASFPLVLSSILRPPIVIS